MFTNIMRVHEAFNLVLCSLTNYKATKFNGYKDIKPCEFVGNSWLCNIFNSVLKMIERRKNDCSNNLQSYRCAVKFFFSVLCWYLCSTSYIFAMLLSFWGLITFHYTETIRIWYVQPFLTWMWLLLVQAIVFWVT